MIASNLDDGAHILQLKIAEPAPLYTLMGVARERETLIWTNGCVKGSAD